MEAYKTDIVVEEDGTVTLGGLPFRKGERLEVILLQRIGQSEDAELYPLRGEPIKYDEPFGGVDEDEWKAPG